MKGLTFVVLSFLAVPLSAIPDLKLSPADGVVQDKSLKPGLVGQYWNFGKEMNKFPEEFVKAKKPDLCRIDGVIDFDSKEERGFKEGRYSITNHRSGLSFHLSWQNKVFPYLWYWQVTRGAFGYPWYGTTYNLALEPHSSLFPMLQRAIDQGHALKLGPDAELSTELEAAISLAA